MKYLSSISLVLLIMLMLYVPVSTYAGGPGFDNDVKNWKNDDDNGDDDDKCEEDDNGDDDYNDDDSNEIPLDGGLSFLAVAGVAYGVKRVRDNKKK